MIVCVCHRVSDRDIRRSVAEGCPSFDALQDELRVATACGACHDCACEVYEDALQASSQPGIRVIPVLLAA